MKYIKDNNMLTYRTSLVRYSESQHEKSQMCLKWTFFYYHLGNNTNRGGILGFGFWDD